MARSITTWQSLPILPLVLIAGMAAVSGCMNTRYDRTPEVTTPAQLLLFSAPREPVVLTVDAVISYHGPGSWKAHALWDEYLIGIQNRDSGAVTIEAVYLTDFLGEVVEPGADPWVLEEESRFRVTEIRRTSGDILRIGASRFSNLSEKEYRMVDKDIAQATAAVSALSAGTAGLGAALYGGATMAGALATGAGVVLVPVAGFTMAGNQINRIRVEREFERRRLELPLTIEPGPNATVLGSLFFRISPGPTRLVLRYRADEETHEVVLNLAPLAGLHLYTGPRISGFGN